jgi:hypothetical protein
VASAAPGEKSDGFFSSLARKVGFGSAADTTATAPPPAPAKPKIIEAKRNEPPRPEAAIPKAAAAPKAADTRQATAKPALKPSLSDAPAPTAAAAPAQVAGSAPIVPSSSFESRFGAMK